MTRLSVCSLGVSCNEMIDTPMLLVVMYRIQGFKSIYLQQPIHFATVLINKTYSTTYKTN